MKSFLKTKRFWATVTAVAMAIVSSLIENPQLREGILAAIVPILVYVAGLFGVEMKRTEPRQ